MGPEDLVQTAAQEPAAAGQDAQPAAAASGGDVGAQPAPATQGDPLAELASVIVSDPNLYDKVESVIREHFGLGGGAPAVPQAQAQAQAQPQQKQQQPGTPVVNQPQADPFAMVLDSRLRYVEQALADIALKEELNQARQAFEGLKQHFPILPDLAEQEVLQLAARYPSVPLQELVKVWAVEKLASGDRPAAERILQAQMQKSAVKDLPPVEGRGGGIPQVPPEAPQSFRQARRSVREFIEALRSGVTGA